MLSELWESIWYSHRYVKPFYLEILSLIATTDVYAVENIFSLFKEK